MRAFLFPGQGSQTVGMGFALAEASRAARDVFDEVDEALGQGLFKLMREGPDDQLRLTENAQPAIMAHALAVFASLTKEGGVSLEKAAQFVAGHSLGEYSALCAAGSFDLATTAKLLKLRGQAMQAAVPVGEGAMAALLGADVELATRIAAAAAILPASSRSAPSSAAIAPTPTGTAACIARPRSLSNLAVVARSNDPAAHSAEYSPRLCPATNCAAFSRLTPPSFVSARNTASACAMIAGWAFSVSVNCSTGPWRISLNSPCPSASSTSPNTSRAARLASASAAPIPTAWLP